MTDLLSRLGRTPSDPDVQAGSRGLSLSDVVDDCFSSAGDVLVIARDIRGLTREALSQRTKLSSALLSEYESGTKVPPPNHLVTLANALDVDLRKFMEAFGAVSRNAPSESMGIAAQFSGDMTEDQKRELKQLVEDYASTHRKP